MDITWAIGVIGALATTISSMAIYIAKMQANALAETKKDCAERMAEYKAEIARLQADKRVKDDKIDLLRDENAKTLGSLRKLEGRIEEAARHNVPPKDRDRGERGAGR